MSDPPRVRIRLSVDVPVGAAAAWARITDPASMAEWSTDATAFGGAGDEYRLGFGDGSVVTGRVRDVVAGRSFAYDWHWEGASKSETTLARWSVRSTRGGVRIVLEREGWGTDDWARRDDHAGYWTSNLDDVAALIKSDSTTPRVD